MTFRARAVRLTLGAALALAGLAAIAAFATTRTGPMLLVGVVALQTGILVALEAASAPSSRPGGTEP
jgi:uncharacterized membrane protein HdeD (DUF308 family)